MAKITQALTRASETYDQKTFQSLVRDLVHPFISDFAFQAIRANALYEGVYLLGTSIARPLIAKKQIEIARETNSEAVCHGATGKGNDQVRFELGYYSLNPNIKVIAPWREWELSSRKKLIEYAEKNQITISRENLVDEVKKYI